MDAVSVAEVVSRISATYHEAELGVLGVWV